MNENGVENSPLKLYRKAYGLHYKERKIAEACDIYEQLIRQFPDSDVSAYASIQLQKIHADEITRTMARRGMPSVFVLVLLVVNLLLLAALGTLLGVYAHRTGAEREKNGVVARALGKMYSGDDDGALDILREVKIGYRNDITPFALSAEIYRKNNDFLRARKEFETYRRLYPKDPLPEIEISEINEQEDTHIRKAMKEKEKPIPEEVVKAEDRRAATRSTKRRTRRPRPVKKTPKLLVPQDSISYF